MRLDDARRNAADNGRAGVGANRSTRGSMRGPRWYAIAAKHQQCHAAALAIEAKKFPVFLPWVSCPLPKGARELRPMFGSYLFVRFDVDSDPWGDITRLPFVPDRPMLHLGDPCRPSPIPDHVVDRIHADIGKRVEDLAARGKHWGVVDDPVAVLVSVGAAVRLTPGVGLSGAGRVLATTKNARLARVEFEGCTLPVWVPSNRLQLLEDA